ncbi:MAG: YggS family pyridoxal phosphate-dependent enzyme [Fusobacterium perfoetens]|uniref:YggS family pyridoxal phosphate-dependent enzyme n=1 Tax=Fusobacterium perfoetens TaxID=852 RepID=UPI0023F41163|nr:YggS family pyridoxal phosphate-dependent enzyme [Fusobacterium perfoetens]MCI6153241.1 YggS family pyridoxal phosphate-dependent enzyme [Fusobacterium perfoetens]MDY3238342.1 YggS family pyridoxal phosphate-dependent enzyme [Fusobacterium perfoetens]
MSSVTKNVQEVLEDIKKYSIYPERVKLVAVTKYPVVTREKMLELIENGVFSFGENRVQVLEEKLEILGEEKNKIKWNFIGNLQKNKVKYIVDFIDMIHSINKLSLAEEIDKRAEKIGRKIDVLIEINLSGEDSKEGYQLEEFYKDMDELIKLKNINICGLMTMAPNTEDENLIRGSFRKLREIRDEVNEKFGNNLKELSMGMSGDYKIALEEGATIIRIGSKLYE